MTKGNLIEKLGVKYFNVVNDWRLLELLEKMTNEIESNQKRIKQLEDRVTSLENRVDILEKRVDAL